VDPSYLIGAGLGAPYYSVDGATTRADGLGAAGTQLLRLGSPAYAEGVSAPNDLGRPGPREVSNAVVRQEDILYNSRGVSDLFWQWGQFLDHDLDLVPAQHAGTAERYDIPVPAGDPHFDPTGTGTQVIPFTRSAYDPATGDSAANPRQQVNAITTFIDASLVYGSDAERAEYLREGSGGRLKVSEGDLLPRLVNDPSAPVPNDGPLGVELFVAGDTRVNEQVGLTAIHTLFVREHNRLADLMYPILGDDEATYQWARQVVTAEIQAITYNEFLPLLIGDDALEAYAGYDATVDPRISNLFSAATFRLGHTLLSPNLLLLDESYQPLTDGPLPLRDAFFSPEVVVQHGIDPILRGFSDQPAQELDNQVVDDVRNFLFGAPGAGGLDLPATNLQRGRDQGLLGYNAVRTAFGLPAVTDFDEPIFLPGVGDALAFVYASVEAIDVWIGGLSEQHLVDAMVGPLIHAVLVDQFTRLRDGDPLWYEGLFPDQDLAWLDALRLSDVIAWNTGIEGIQDEVFLASHRYQAPAPGTLALVLLGLPLFRRALVRRGRRLPRA
jgi:hypothetical protein